MAKYPDRHSATLPALGAAQRVHGWCSPEAILQVAAVMQVTPAYLSSVATFYDMLRTEPSGRRYVYVCTSVACHLRDAKAVYDAIEQQARARGSRTWRSASSSASAPATWRRWRRSTAATSARWARPTRPSSSARSSRAASPPGRGLSDPDYRLPWEEGGEAPDRPARAGGAGGAPGRRHLGGRAGAERAAAEATGRGRPRARRSRSHRARARPASASTRPRATEARSRSERDAPAAGQHRRARPQQDRRLRAPRRLPRAAQGAARDDARGGAPRARGVGPARPRRRRLLDGQEGLLHPQGRDGQVPLLQRRRVRAGHLQGPRC